VAKVVFQLHASFAQPIREYTEPPFEVTERGWGEFEAQIRIHWKDPAEKVTIVSTWIDHDGNHECDHSDVILGPARSIM